MPDKPMETELQRLRRMLQTTQAALRDSEEKYRLTFESITDSLTVTRIKDGLYRYVNDGFCQQTGYSREEVLGRTPADINLYAVPADRDMFIDILRRDGKAENVVVRFRRKNGEVYFSEFSAKPITFAGEDCLLAQSRDINERKRAEAEQEKLQNQLAQAQKMESVGRLAGGVAHDFNNMLSVILGYAELALEQVPPSQPLHPALMEIQKAAARASDVTRQLLAFARKQTVALKVLDLNRTIGSMLKMLRHLIGEDIDLEWRPAPEPLPVKVDPSQIDQILANLCVNARDAIASVGRIVIETGSAHFSESHCAGHPGFLAGDFVRLSVSDDGCGMDEYTLENLFEPFFTTKSVDKGTGLGLATVYGIVKQNNGFVNVFSRPNEGTTISIYLPRLAAAGAPVQPKASPADAAGGSGTVLLVEDEPAILKMTAMMLERLGYTVLTAPTPGKAVALAREHAGEVHLLLTDVVMPEMTGRELAERLLSVFPNLKVLYMSGYTADVIARHGVLGDGLNFIHKPFSKAALSVKVREALGSSPPGAGR